MKPTVRALTLLTVVLCTPDSLFAQATDYDTRVLRQDLGCVRYRGTCESGLIWSSALHESVRSMAAEGAARRLTALRAAQIAGGSCRSKIRNGAVIGAVLGTVVGVAAFKGKQGAVLGVVGGSTIGAIAGVKSCRP